MKKIFIFTLLGLFLQASIPADAQILKKLKQKVEKKVDKKVDETIDKGLEKSEGKAETKETDSLAKKTSVDKSGKSDAPGEAGQTPLLNWAKYDFVPGDKIIFEDNQLHEENGEFPSRWDLNRGDVEIAEFGGEPVIMFHDGAPTIVPYMKNSKDDYLPDVFTIEFDLYCGTDNFVAYLYDRKNQKSGSPSGYTYFNIKNDRMEFGQSSSKLGEGKSLEKRRWIHVAIAYTNGKLKGYMDETRMINVPRIDFDPKGLSLHSYHARNDNLYYVKNVRIAAGGIKYYDRVLQDGKIIANGIRFDVNKASLKPESMGVINEIAALMKEHPEISFSVEGHTDSDGDDASNLELSEKRAATVINTLVELGIDAQRLSSKGWGESKPIDTNATAEGKANNRRVEFIKQ